MSLEVAAHAGHSPLPRDAVRPRLEMIGITKAFPGVRALDRVDFTLQPGEIHALVGENGAGKSTLLKILAGVYPHSVYQGEIRVDGHPVRFHNVHDAQAAGIAVVYQELSLVSELSVAENIFLGREPRSRGTVSWDALYAGAAKLLSDLHLGLDPWTPVARLGVAQQQLVEIAKALCREACILVLDEPTAALSEAEVELLATIMRRLKARGIGVIFVSHRLREVFMLSDRVTVLRDGRRVGSETTDALDERQVIAMMIGRELAGLFPPAGRSTGEVALEVKNFSVEDPRVPGRRLVDDVSFTVRRGEVLGIAGLMGAGRTELLTGIFGAHPGRVSGEVRVTGRVIRVRTPASAIEAGVGLAPEDRRRYGLVLDQSVLHNVTLGALGRLAGRLATDVHREMSAAESIVRDLRIKTPSLLSAVGTLSGGNQQKVVLGKWLIGNPTVLLLDEPTRGVDVGARQEIYNQIDRLAREGLAIVLVSSELPELVGLADRVLVLRQGRSVGEFSKSTMTPEAIMACASGH